MNSINQNDFNKYIDDEIRILLRTDICTAENVLESLVSICDACYKYIDLVTAGINNANEASDKAHLESAVLALTTTIDEAYATIFGKCQNIDFASERLNKRKFTIRLLEELRSKAFKSHSSFDSHF